MNIDEKLTHFYDSVMEDSRAQAAALLESHEKNLKEMFENHAAQQRQTAQAEIHAETEHARREMNKALFNEQLSLKRAYTEKQTELTERLFAEVKELLQAFLASPEYIPYLEKKICAAKRFAGRDSFTVYLTPEDERLSEELSSRTGVALKIAQESFLGGIRTEIPDRNILIDDSLRSAVESMRKNYKLDGGMLP